VRRVSIPVTSDPGRVLDPELRQQFVADLLRAGITAASIITDATAMRPFETDGLTAKREMPAIVVLPETVQQVRAVVAACRARKLPIVTRGAGTGLSGGARPNRDAVLLVLSKLARIIEIDPYNCTARVEPGVRNLAISEAAAEFGLFYAPDPSSQIACSIGGNVAENAGGVHCLKYGLTVHNVLGLKVLTYEGAELTLGGSALDSPGYDLLALMIGSEGLLGIVTEVTVRLLPKPLARRLVLASFADLRDAGDAVAAVIAAGIVPGGLEMMDQLAIRAAEDFAAVGYPTDAAAILLCELDGTPDEVDAQSERVVAVFETAGATEVRRSTSERELESMWRGRKAAFPAVGRMSPDYYCMDGTIPRARLGEVLTEISRLAETHGLAVANVFHAGDGNLHPLILYDGNRTGQLEAAEALGARILELCVAVGGTITGEHGVGIEKIDQMCVQFSSAELTQFHAVKAAFDPGGKLNPGKAVPVLARCAELGGMHVHGGQVPFPDIERF
jgi:glycolate oxidase